MRANLFVGSLWSALNAAVVLLSPILIVVFSAKYLSPEIIGAFGFAVAVAELIKVLTPQGLYEVLISSKTTAEEDRAASGILGLCSAASLIVYVIIIYVYIHHGPNVDERLEILYALGLKIPLDIMVVQPQAVLARRLMFSRIGMRSVLANSLGTAAGLALMLAGWPVLGLAAYYLLISLTGLFAVTLGTGALAWPSFRFAHLARVMHDALYASGVRLLGAVNNYADQALGAALFAPAQLGQYVIAKRVETALMTGSSSFAGILFQPLFASRDEAGRPKLIEGGLVMVMVLFAAPTLAFAALAAPLVSAVLGPVWTVAAPIIALTAMSGVARSLGGIFGALLSVTGRNRSVFRVSLASALSGLGVLALGVFFGMTFVAAGYLIKNLAALVMFAVLSFDRLGQGLRILGRTVVLPGLLMAGADLLALAAGLQGQVDASRAWLFGAWGTLACINAAIAASFGVGMLYGMVRGRLRR